jgi:hypothetical protein
METLARMARRRNPDQTTPGSMRRASQLGGVEEQKWSSTNVQDDPNTNRTRVVWGIPGTHRKSNNVHMSSLQDERGHGAAHTSSLPGVGRTKEGIEDEGG